MYFSSLDNSKWLKVPFKTYFSLSSALLTTMILKLFLNNSLLLPTPKLLYRTQPPPPPTNTNYSKHSHKLKLKPNSKLGITVEEPKYLTPLFSIQLFKYILYF